MLGNNGKIRHVNGAGEVRWFTPQVAANKAAMKNGGWFPQPEANTERFFGKKADVDVDSIKKEIEEYKALSQEKDNKLIETHAEYEVTLKSLTEEKDATIAELTAIITDLRTEIEQLKSEQATTKKYTKKQDEPK